MVVWWRTDSTGEESGEAREEHTVTFDSFRMGVELRAACKAALAADARWRRRRREMGESSSGMAAIEALAGWVSVAPLEQARELAR